MAKGKRKPGKQTWSVTSDDRDNLSGNDSNASDAGTKPRTKKQRYAEWLPNKCKTYLQFDNSNKETYKQFQIYIKEMIKSLNIKSH